MAVRRGASVYLERMSSRQPQLEVDLYSCVESAVRYEGAPTDTFTGLSHLNGRYVWVTARNSPPYGPLLVSGGQVTTPEEVGANYQAAGDDRWLALSVGDDEAWPRLCETIGRADLAKDPGLATAAGRRVRHDELDAAISAWTRTQDAATAAAARHNLLATSSTLSSQYSVLGRHRLHKVRPDESAPVAKPTTATGHMAAMGIPQFLKRISMGVISK